MNTANMEMVINVAPDFKPAQGDAFDAVIAALEHFNIPTTYIVRKKQVAAELPFDLVVDAKAIPSTVSSSLHNEGLLWSNDDTDTDKVRANDYAVTIELLLLNLAHAGVNVQTAQFANALTATVETLTSY